MNKDELIEKIKVNKEETKKITKRSEELKKEKEKLNDILEKGLTFPSLDITRIIAYLLTIYENKLYIPIYGYYYDSGNQYDYMYLVPVDDFAALENKEKYFKFGWRARYNNQLVIVSEKHDSFQGIDKNNGHRLTFSHLLEEYGTSDVNERVCIEKFDDYPYIKEFISMVSAMQIEKNERLDKGELWMAMSDFINSKKDKPKTRELNKNN